VIGAGTDALLDGGEEKTPPSANTENTTKKLNALMRWSALIFQWSRRY